MIDKDLKIFIDTSAWIMLLNSDEHFHKNAAEVYDDLPPFNKYTSNHIISETYTWLQRKIGHQKALSFLETIKKMQKDNLIKVIWSIEAIEDHAVEILKKYKDQDFSYVDATSFAIIKKYDIDNAFAYDNHFLVMGIPLINKLYSS